MKKFYFLLLSSILTFTLNAQKTQILVGANNNGAVFNCFLDGANPTIVNTGQSYYSFYGSVEDPSAQKVYMSWYYGIYAMNYDGSNFVQLYNYSTGGMGGAIDLYNNQIYFVDENHNICKMDTNGLNKTTISSGVNYASDVQIDTANSLIYASGWLNSGFYKMNLNGSGFTTIFTSNSPSNFKIDFASQKVFFCESSTTYSADLTGTNITPIHNFQVGEIDIYQNRLYMTDMSNVRVISSDFDGSNIDVLVQVGDIMFGPDNFDIPSGLVLLKNDSACNGYIDNTITSVFGTISSNCQLPEATFQWLNCYDNYSIFPGATTSSVTPNTGGSFAVEISTASCKDTSICEVLSFSDTKEYRMDNINLFPNPTSGSFRIDAGSNKITHIKIYSIDGKLLDNLIFSANHEYSLPFEKGYYFVEIWSDEETKTIKLLKE